MSESSNKRGIALVLSGPSGVGKDAVREPLLAACPGLRQSISATTRPMRPGERDGVDYHFLTKEDFEAAIRREEFLEYTLYNGNYYGTPAPFAKKELDEGKDLLFKIEVQGALNVKRFFPDAVLVFLVPPSMEVLWKRMTGRGTEDPETQKARFHTAYRELEFASQYDYIVTNGDLNETVEHVRAIYLAEKARIDRSMALVKTLLQEEIQ